MKKTLIFISTVIVLSLSISTLNAAIVNVKKDGRDNGNGNVTYSDIIEIGPIYVSCKNPGGEACPSDNTNYFRDHGALSHQCDAFDYARQQISLGTLTGNTVLYGTTNVKWNATDVNETTSLIKVWDIGEPEPEDEGPTAP